MIGLKMFAQLIPNNKKDGTLKGNKGREQKTMMTYLTFNKYRHIHEHVMQFSNAVFKFHYIIVPCFNVLQ